MLGLVQLISVMLPLQRILELLYLLDESVLLHIPLGTLLLEGQDAIEVLLLRFFALFIELVVLSLPFVVLSSSFVAVIHHQVLLLPF
jgi:hypothetical protein